MRFYEFDEFNSLVAHLPEHGEVERICDVRTHELSFPVNAVRFGSGDLASPVVCVVAGVHGLERIGSTVALSFLRWFIANLSWDSGFVDRLSKMRVIFVPILNPVGMFRKSRANGNGIDLMRNAPVESSEVSRWFLAGGHRLSPKLPWHRGLEHETMQLETDSLAQFAERELFPSKCAIVLDLHSGFGFNDRLWFPFAHTKQPVPNIAEFFAFYSLMNLSIPDHVYCMEPQSHSYTTHGDLWDYLLMKKLAAGGTGTFLPLCLEMGSWSWIRKNPRQIFTRPGVFNPILPHRARRIRRRHLSLFDFLLRSAISWCSWLPQSSDQKNDFKWRGLSQWYGQSKPTGSI